MEKFVHRLSTILTFILVYIAGAYTYLSAKGFVYENGTFTLIRNAEAKTSETENHQDFATTLDDTINLNFSAPVILGDENAPLTLYEFSSLGCSHCADFHLNILPKLKKDFIDSGKLKVIFVNFPLEKKSMQGAMLFECVPADYRHNFLDLAFAHQRDWSLSFNSEKHLIGYAVSSGVKQVKAENCLHNDNVAKKILSERQDAMNKLDINGTPVFVVADQNKKEIIYGLKKYDQFLTYLNQRLAD